MAIATHKLDPYAEELFQKIKDQKVTIDPIVWTLLTHVLGNRVYSITLILGDYLSTPRWILRSGSAVMKFLYWISGNKGKVHGIEEILERSLSNAYTIKEFMKQLRETTQQKQGF